MEMKEKVLQALEKERGEFISGEALAERLGVSRNAVWKSVRALIAQGYAIRSVKNRGYALSVQNDKLSAASVGKFLRDEYDIRVYGCVGSTNEEAKKAAAAGAPEWTVLIAEEQRAGKGRFDRKFDSPKGEGVYMSVVLRPRFSAFETLYITTSAAVAVCEAIEEVAEKYAEIKWVNDVYIGGKKVCGILTEASFDVESGGLSYAVVGIGINVKEREFPPEIEKIAGAVFSRGEYPPEGRARLVAAVLQRFRAYYEKIGERAFLPEYRARSLVVGKRVHVMCGALEGDATVLSLDDRCFLRVRFDEGKECTLSAGEVSIKVF